MPGENYHICHKIHLKEIIAIAMVTIQQKISFSVKSVKFGITQVVLYYVFNICIIPR